MGSLIIPQVLFGESSVKEFWPVSVAWGSILEEVEEVDAFFDRPAVGVKMLVDVLFRVLVANRCDFLRRHWRCRRPEESFSPSWLQVLRAFLVEKSPGVIR